MKQVVAVAGARRYRERERGGREAKVIAPLRERDGGGRAAKFTGDAAAPLNCGSNSF